MQFPSKTSSGNFSLQKKNTAIKIFIDEKTNTKRANLSMTFMVMVDVVNFLSQGWYADHSSSKMVCTLSLMVSLMVSRPMKYMQLYLTGVNSIRR